MEDIEGGIDDYDCLITMKLYYLVTSIIHIIHPHQTVNINAIQLPMVLMGDDDESYHLGSLRW